MEAIALQRRGAAELPNRRPSLHPLLKAVRKNEKKTGEWIMDQQVTLRVDLNENDLLL